MHAAAAQLPVVPLFRRHAPAALAEHTHAAPLPRFHSSAPIVCSGCAQHANPATTAVCTHRGLPSSLHTPCATPACTFMYHDKCIVRRIHASCPLMSRPRRRVFCARRRGSFACPPVPVPLSLSLSSLSLSLSLSSHRTGHLAPSSPSLSRVSRTRSARARAALASRSRGARGRSMM